MYALYYCVIQISRGGEWLLESPNPVRTPVASAGVGCHVWVNLTTYVLFFFMFCYRQECFPRSPFSSTMLPAEIVRQLEQAHREKNDECVGGSRITTCLLKS